MRLLVTGASGQIAGALSKRLAVLGHDVWGIARFGDAARRRELAAAGVTTRVVDLTEPDWSAVPTDFDHVLHLAVQMGPSTDFNHALQVNAVGTGRLISRFREVRSILSMSTTGVYRPDPDPWHRYAENDPLGDPTSPTTPTYGVSKIGQEAVARFAAEEFDVPVVIGRMNMSYGPGGGRPMKHLDLLLADEVITLRYDPAPSQLIYEDDIADHALRLLCAASTPALVVNFGGDEAVAAQQWIAYLGELLGRSPRTEVVPIPGSQPGIALDVTRRQSITGPDKVHWREGIRRMVEARLARA